MVKSWANDLHSGKIKSIWTPQMNELLFSLSKLIEKDERQFNVNY